jgi:hypothetical protein
VIDRGRTKQLTRGEFYERHWVAISMIANRIKYLKLTVECIENGVWNLNG